LAPEDHCLSVVPAAGTPTPLDHQDNQQLTDLGFARLSRPDEDDLAQRALGIDWLGTLSVCAPDYEQIIGRPFVEGNPLQICLMLAGEPATWLRVSPDPDSPDWEWKLWSGPLRPFAVDFGAAGCGTALGAAEVVGKPTYSLGIVWQRQQATQG